MEKERGALVFRTAARYLKCPVYNKKLGGMQTNRKLGPTHQGGKQAAEILERPQMSGSADKVSK